MYLFIYLNYHPSLHQNTTDHPICVMTNQNTQNTCETKSLLKKRYCLEIR